jgi:hypothetical protein
MVNVADSEFLSNEEDPSEGGGLYVYGGKRTTVSNCIFEDNHSVSGGGMYVTNAGVLTVQDSTFSGKSAGRGGAMYLTSSVGRVTLKNNSVNAPPNTAGRTCDDVFHENEKDPYYTCKDVNGKVAVL